MKDSLNCFNYIFYCRLITNNCHTHSH
jgi:hypothetical protein